MDPVVLQQPSWVNNLGKALKRSRAPRRKLPPGTMVSRSRRSPI